MMKKKKQQVVIPFIGLKDGIHHYEYEIDSTFFEQFDYSIIEKANFRVKVVFDKRKNLFELDFKLEGYIFLNCDRCLEKLKIDREGEQNLIVKFGDENYNETDEIRVLAHQEYELDITNEIYQYIHLLLPSRAIHENEEDCNQEVVEKLKKLSNKQKNETVDPRWAALSNLKDNSE